MIKNPRKLITSYRYIRLMPDWPDCLHFVLECGHINHGGGYTVERHPKRMACWICGENERRVAKIKSALSLDSSTPAPATNNQTQP